MIQSFDALSTDLVIEVLSFLPRHHQNAIVKYSRVLKPIFSRISPSLFKNWSVPPLIDQDNKHVKTSRFDYRLYKLIVVGSQYHTPSSLRDYHLNLNQLQQYLTGEDEISILDFVTHFSHIERLHIDGNAASLYLLALLRNMPRLKSVVLLSEDITIELTDPAEQKNQAAQYIIPPLNGREPFRVAVVHAMVPSESRSYESIHTSRPVTTLNSDGSLFVALSSTVNLDLLPFYFLGNETCVAQFHYLLMPTLLMSREQRLEHLMTLARHIHCFSVLSPKAWLTLLHPDYQPVYAIVIERIRNYETPLDPKNPYDPLPHNHAPFSLRMMEFLMQKPKRSQVLIRLVNDGGFCFDHCPHTTWEFSLVAYHDLICHGIHLNFSFQLKYFTFHASTPGHPEHPMLTEVKSRLTKDTLRQVHTKQFVKKLSQLPCHWHEEVVQILTLAMNKPHSISYSMQRYFEYWQPVLLAVCKQQDLNLLDWLFQRQPLLVFPCLQSLARHKRLDHSVLCWIADTKQRHQTSHKATKQRTTTITDCSPSKRARPNKSR